VVASTKLVLEQMSDFYTFVVKDSWLLSALTEDYSHVFYAIK
jgi:hypothetical protein